MTDEEYRRVLGYVEEALKEEGLFKTHGEECQRVIVGLKEYLAIEMVKNYQDKSAQ